VDAKPYTISTQSEIYQLGFELRASSKGEGHGGRALNDATTQVLRGLNGLIDQVRPSVVPDDREAIFLPVIFTTAALWVSDGDLGAANLKTGHLPNGWATVKKVPWLWYSYNQSPTLRHQYSSVSKIFDFRRVLYAEYTRSVAIVGCEGIETFLQRNFDWLTP
jgi:hypothetical protein